MPETENQESKSEFGKGLTYCIGLFLAHQNVHFSEESKKIMGDTGAGGWPEMWFNGASDHLYQLDTSVIQDESLKQEIDAWRDKVLHWGHGFSTPWATAKDIEWALGRAREFLRIIDEKLLGVKVEEGEWE